MKRKGMFQTQQYVTTGKGYRLEYLCNPLEHSSVGRFFHKDIACVSLPGHGVEPFHCHHLALGRMQERSLRTVTLCA